MLRCVIYFSGGGDEVPELREPYRVVVWGPGEIGQSAIRELVRLPETDLVGVLAYSDAKNGVDVGTLLGGDPVGVTATTDPQAILALEPECVLYTARDFGDYRQDEDIVMLLEAGINVVTVMSYQYPRARGADIEQRLSDAGKKGGATLLGTGIDPGFIFERLAALMTGVSNDIEFIRLDEYFNMHRTSADLLGLFGFGNTEEQIREHPVAAIYAANYLTMGMRYLADQLGVPIARIEQSHRHRLSDHDASIPGVHEIKAGTVGTVAFEWIGYTGEDRPMFQIQTNWYLNASLRPPEAKGDNYWILHIEGLPSTRLGLEIKGSIARDEEICDRHPASAGYLATVIPAIQAIPLAIEAEPGVHVAAMPELHWKPDMRLSPSASQTVGLA
jgi:2,4-diaminopentanoate dehydrogenase